MKNNVFKRYAAYYDALYLGKDYSSEASFVHSHLQKNLKGSSKLAEFGCGTGLHALEFLKHGYSIEAYDMSSGMLQVAKKRFLKVPASKRKNISFHCGDIRSLKGQANKDIVISLFHVMSYQVSDHDLMSALQSAASFLKKGGLFLFDYWHGPGVLHQPPECRVKKIQLQDWEITRVAEPVHDTLLNKVDVHYTLWMQHRKTGKIRVEKEVHPMRYLFPKELEYFAKCSGFEVVTHTKWLDKGTPNLSDWVAAIILRKK